MHKRPLGVISVFFIIGIILARFLPDSVRLSYVFVATSIFILLCLLLTLISRRAGLNLAYGSKNSTRSSLTLAPLLHTFLFLSIISLGSLLYLNSNIFPSNHISHTFAPIAIGAQYSAQRTPSLSPGGLHFLGKDKVKAEITGIIKSPAEARGVYFGKVSSRYLFEIETVASEKLKVKGERSNWQRIEGLALIRIETEKDYQYGDRLLVKGTIKRPGLASDTSRLRPSLRSGLRSKNIVRAESRTNFDYKAYLENQNIFAIINANEKNITLLAHNYKVNPILRFAYLVREKLKKQFLEKMPLETGAFLRAILLGDRSELPKKLNESFRSSGTMHILAISGLNVALIAAAFLYFFRLLRIKRKISYTLTMLLLVFLMILTGSSASVVRATIMCIVFLTGLLLGRPVDAYNSLGAAAFFILIINPKDIFNIGFQLSFIAVLSMVYLTPKLMQSVKKDWNFYVRKYLLEPFAVSISATLGTFPFILYYFRMATPIAIVSNILIVPLMFVLMIGGMCFIVLGRLPFLGGILSCFNDMLANIIFFLAEFFAKVKFGHFNV